MENHELCVAGFCLPADYIKLNLPSSDRQHIKMNLEVKNTFIFIKFMFPIYTQFGL